MDKKGLLWKQLSPLRNNSPGRTSSPDPYKGPASVAAALSPQQHRSPYRSDASVASAPVVSSPRGRALTPTRGPPSVASRGSAQTSPRPSSRGGSPAHSASSQGTYRTSSMGRKVHENESREGRLLALVREFDLRILRPWGARVHDIHNRFTKLNFVSEEEQRFLRQARGRNQSFMHNIEAILKDAVADNVGLDAAVTRQAYALWADGNSMVDRIDGILGYCNKPSSVSVAAVTGVAPVVPRGRTSSPTPRAMSPAERARRAPSPKPTSLDQVRPLPKKAPLHKEQASSVEKPLDELERGERRRMLEGLDSLSKRAALTASDLLWAQSIFERLYGADGASKFQEWCMELTRR